MKPNQQQKQWLHDYLYQVMKYRETYEEVYDHILTALENKQEAKFFEDTVSEIIAEDFSATNGLYELEESAKRTAGKEVINQYWSYFRHCLKFPVVIYIIGIYLAIYNGVRLTHAKPLIMLLVDLCLLIIPILLFAVRGFRAGYKFGNTKTALRDGIFRRIIYRPVFYFWAFQFLRPAVFVLIFGASENIHANIHVVSTVNFCISTIIMCTLIIHNLCCFKLYNSEFKTTLISA